MDVTPPPALYEVMEHLTTAMCGLEPGPTERTTAADKVRTKRKMMMDVLHQMVALSMREGAARALNPNRTTLGAMQARIDMELADGRNG